MANVVWKSKADVLEYLQIQNLCTPIKNVMNYGQVCACCGTYASYNKGQHPETVSSDSRFGRKIQVSMWKKDEAVPRPEYSDFLVIQDGEQSLLLEWHDV